ncbi:hypothetical protein C7447_1081 [Tenacibaculum adriaticum]|uniref:Uncharacterized protein n=1 Tax=Tenacibaculum adriaticum TaxID=413713 RepID=A0A5S5DK13_9FLAO|nr:hypothetical protein [Tenacibaculum adriaticum]TYP96251.1 hypothetical protein C7447_1081 [Tenacibaculum adriaticum]
MVKKILILLLLPLFLTCCIGYHRIPKDNNGEPILNEKVNYKFAKIPNEKDLTKIDTSAYYVQIFEGRYYNDNEKKNPQILIFHNDGFFKKTSTLYYLKYDSRNKKSVYYGGKYKIKENTIELEQFYPSRGGKTNYYSRNITKGEINGDKLIFDNGPSLFTIYEKKYNLN